MEQSRFWAADIYPASQEIPFILWSLKDYYCLVPILSQMDPVHTHFLSSGFI